MQVSANWVPVARFRHSRAGDILLFVDRCTSTTPVFGQFLSSRRIGRSSATALNLLPNEEHNLEVLRRGVFQRVIVKVSQSLLSNVVVPSMYLVAR